MRLTLKAARDNLALRGMLIAKTGYGKEYRVSYAPYRMASADHREASAYYTDDIEDAVSTGNAMADELDSLEGEGN